MEFNNNRSEEKKAPSKRSTLVLTPTSSPKETAVTQTKETARTGYVSINEPVEGKRLVFETGPILPALQPEQVEPELGGSTGTQKLPCITPPKPLHAVAATTPNGTAIVRNQLGHKDDLFVQQKQEPTQADLAALAKAMSADVSMTGRFASLRAQEPDENDALATSRTAVAAHPSSESWTKYPTIISLDQIPEELRALTPKSVEVPVTTTPILDELPATALTSRDTDLVPQQRASSRAKQFLLGASLAGILAAALYLGWLRSPQGETAAQPTTQPMPRAVPLHE